MCYLKSGLPSHQVRVLSTSRNANKRPLGVWPCAERSWVLHRCGLRANALSHAKWHGTVCAQVPWDQIFRHAISMLIFVLMYTWEINWLLRIVRLSMFNYSEYVMPGLYCKGLRPCFKVQSCGDVFFFFLWMPFQGCRQHLCTQVLLLEFRLIWPLYAHTK